MGQDKLSDTVSDSHNLKHGNQRVKDSNHNNSLGQVQPDLDSPVAIESVKPTNQNESTSSTSLSKSESSSRKISKKSQLAEEEVNRAIDAIINFNNTEDISHKDKWHIGVSALRKLTDRGDSVVKRVLESRTDEIQQHHALHQIGQRHNSKGKDYPSINEIISF